ncbi:MAG: response regulator [Candidatus Latescibacteria bacterium]|nr:response regulator [Candidatus Latescibacterota bacterium]
MNPPRFGFQSALDARGVTGWSLEKKLNAGFGVAFVLLCVIGVILYWGRIRHAGTTEEERGTIEILDNLDTLTFMLIRLETEEHDYITSRGSALEQSQPARASVNRTLQGLRRLTANDSLQQRQLDILEPLLAREFVMIEEIVEVRKNQGPEAMLQVFPRIHEEIHEKKAFDEIQTVIRTMEHEAYKVLDRQHERMERDLHQTMLITASGGLLACVLVVLTGWILSRGLTERKRMEETLRQARDELEARVQERTAALAQANEELQTKIIELQKTQDELRQTQQAAIQQERLRALGQMASGIVHDINNMLTSVLGHSELLLMESGLNDQTRQSLQNIKRAGEDIAHTVTRMREFYRQRGQTETLGPVKLNPLVQEVIGLIRPKWWTLPQEHGIVIDMQTDLREDVPLVPGIESEIREALTNLIFNAVDAMPEGGTVTVRTSVEDKQGGRGAEEQRGEKSSSSHVVLEVSDTGTGMDEQTKQRCLEPFFATKGEKGTGLGLAMVFGVMQRHKGEIAIESELGKGTTMRLGFPLYSEEAQEVRPEAEGSRPGRPLRILCIDDELSPLGLVKEMLMKDRHTVEVANGGQAGLETFHAAQNRGEPFEVVITGLGMPHVDGLAVASTIKQHSPSTPVVLLTGWDLSLGATKRTFPHIDMVITKPPHLNQLRQALARVTESSPHDLPVPFSPTGGEKGE